MAERRRASGHRARAYATTEAPPPIALSAAELAELVARGVEACANGHLKPDGLRILLWLVEEAEPGRPLVRSQAGIAAATSLPRSTTAAALRQLDELRFLNAHERCRLRRWEDGRPGMQRVATANAYELLLPARDAFATPARRRWIPNRSAENLRKKDKKEEVLTPTAAVGVAHLQALLGMPPRRPAAGDPLAARIAAVEAARTADWASRHRLE